MSTNTTKSQKPMSLKEKARAGRRPGSASNSTTKKTNRRDVHPLLQRMGVTEIPPILRQIGVTAEALDGMDVDELRSIAQRVQTLSRRLRYAGPQNDEELWLWVKQNLGVSIPPSSCLP